MGKIGILTQFPDLQFNLDKDLYLFLAKKYKKIYLIDLSFKPKKILLPKNIVHLKPKNYNDLKIIFYKKKYLCFTFIDRNLINLKMNLFLKNFNIKHFYLIRSGTIKMNEHLFYNPSIFKKFKTILSILIYKFFTILNLTFNYEILFISQRFKISTYHSRRNKNLNKIFKTNNFFLYKKIIKINDKTYDLNTLKKNTKKNNKICFIDTPLDKPDKIPSKFKANENEKKIFYRKLCIFLNNISKKTKKEVVISLHPKSPNKFKKKYFKNFECQKYNSLELIKNSYFTLFLSSTLISDAIFLKKKLFVIKSDLIGKFHLYRVNQLINRYKINFINLDKFNFKDHNLFKLNLNQSNKIAFQQLNKEIILNQRELGVRKVNSYLEKYL